jgi:hypothetical protein
LHHAAVVGVLCRGGLSFSEFMELVLDGVLLDGKFEEYR